jgi:NAD(P)-dependent dehydrogenase (short-subunit alcohol dehydrogenase family)
VLLQDKVAVIYGAEGIGGAVAREFAIEGATVFVIGRNWWPVELVAEEILAAGGYAEPSVVDDLDGEAVEAHLRSVIRYLGRVDISFNALDLPDETVLGSTTSNFLTARLAAKHMVVKRSGGVILIASGPPAHMCSSPSVGGWGPAQAAREAMTRALSHELAPHGIRVVGLRVPNIPETETMAEVSGTRRRPDAMTSDQVQAHLASTGNPIREITFEEIAKVAVLVASDRARGLTGTIVDLTMGAVDG